VTLVKRIVVVLVTLLVLSVAAAGYFRIGWYGMESECSLSDANAQVHESVAFSWSWNPVGFTCTYDDGTSETSLWF